MGPELRHDSASPAFGSGYPAGHLANFIKMEAKIPTEIKKARRILLTLHLGPDGDSVGSVFAVWRWLERIGKKVTVVSFDPVPQEFGFLEEVKKVKKEDVAKLDLTKFGLWLLLDSSDWNMVTKTENFAPLPSLTIVNIDHHPTNKKMGKINLVLPQKSSVAEIIFGLFKKWQVKIDEEMATRLFLGIFMDTGGFFYFNASPETMRIGAELLRMGADKKRIILELYRSQSLGTLKYWAAVLTRMKVDKKRRFAISAIPNKILKELKLGKSERGGAAGQFLPIVKDTDFGVLLDEENSGEVSGSLRAKGDFDVARIALEMGGGGHQAAAGFRMKGSLKEVEGKLLNIIDKIRNSKR
jgi:phosphoesterase RecJ-like protein